MTSPRDSGVVDVELPTERGEGDEVLTAFDTLAAGQSLVIRAERVPAELLHRLQQERKGTFEWSVLQADRALCRIRLTRRASTHGDNREVNEALAWDHDRLEALDQQAFERLSAGDEGGARAAWSEFTFGLRRHIRFEEDLLFPTFEERLGVPPEAGPTAVMRAEHREIERLMEAMGEAFGNQGEILRLRAELHRVLGDHNFKEERVLYPATDRALDPEERDALVARIQAS